MVIGKTENLCLLLLSFNFKLTVKFPQRLLVTTQPPWIDWFVIATKVLQNDIFYQPLNWSTRFIKTFWIKDVSYCDKNSHSTTI